MRVVISQSMIEEGISSAEESANAIRMALRALLRRHKPKAIDAAISRSVGYLNKYCRGDSRIPIDVLLSTLCVMGVDPGRFFANALNTPRERDRALQDIAGGGAIAPGLAAIEKATAQLPGGEPPIYQRGKVSPEQWVERVAACGVVEQRRRLRTAQRYRHPAFARAFLEHLDALRYDRPQEAARTAQVVATYLVPMVGGPPAERLALQLEAIGIYASAQRMLGLFATAARALRFALQLARDEPLPEMTAKLLQRSAYLLSDHALFTEAMELLDEAVVIYFDLQSELGLGMVSVDRGNMHYYQGEYKQAISVLSRSLDLLQADGPVIRRNRAAAYQILACCYQGLGDLDSTEKMLAESVRNAEREGEINKAKILWQVGAVALEKGFPAQAEKHLRQAQAILADRSTTDRALVALDLSRALVATGKSREAYEVALSMTEFLGPRRENKILDAALGRHLRNVLEGRLESKDLGKVRNLLLQDAQRART